MKDKVIALRQVLVRVEYQLGIMAEIERDQAIRGEMQALIRHISEVLDNTEIEIEA